MKSVLITFDQAYYERIIALLDRSVYLPGADYKGYGGGKIEWIRGVINGQDGMGTKYEASSQPDK